MLGFWGWYKADNIQLVKERDKLLSYLTEYLSKEIRDQLMEQGADHGEKGFMASVVYIMLEEVNFMTIAELEVEYRTNNDWWRKKLQYKMRNNTIKSHHFHISNLSRKIIEEGKKSMKNK